MILYLDPDKKISADATKFSSGLTNEQLSGHVSTYNIHPFLSVQFFIIMFCQRACLLNKFNLDLLFLLRLETRCVRVKSIKYKYLCLAY